MDKFTATPVMLHDIPFFQGLSEERLAELSRSMQIKNCRQGRRLDRDVEHTVYFIYRGIAAVCSLTKTGSRKILFFQGAGQLLSHNVTNARPNMLFYEIMEDAILLAADRETFSCLVSRDLQLSAALLRHYEINLWRMGHQLKNTAGYMPMERKLAIKLQKLAKEFGIPDTGGTRIRFPITVTQLADFIGAPRETTSRSLKKLSDWNLVLRLERYIVIPDMDNLAEYCRGGTQT